MRNKMVIVRGPHARPAFDGVRVMLTRKTPPYVKGGAQNQTDYFVLADDEALERCKAQGSTVVELTDGWYPADDDGGVVIWGRGKYWEVRDTTFKVKENIGALDRPTEKTEGEILNVRQAILGS